MKELSIEQKAQRYDEAIEKAKIWHIDCQIDFKKSLELLFPELKESKDERIWIINYLSNKILNSTIIAEKENLKKAIAWLEKQGGQKPTDKVEPKFKVGDWLIYNIPSRNPDICIVTEITDDLCKNRKIGEDRIRDNSIEFVNHNYRPWSIQDAKEGDVLACENGWTCIFKTLVNDETFSSYCFMDDTKWFCETGSECHTLKEEFVKAYNGKIYPATKEQRDQLEKAMANAGYTFDFEKKELKKIEQKPAWSEEDDLMLKSFVNLVEMYYGGCIDKTEKNKMLDWLKSLKDRYTWKPSEGQMDALNDVISSRDIKYDVLSELWKDLKKLREE